MNPSITAVVLAALLALPAAAQDQQVGARTKAMGGSYTAFEDDPVSVWLNPAGIATQPDQASISYQTYTAYPVNQERGPGSTTVTSVQPDTILVEPAIIPAYLGFTFQVGDSQAPMSVGFCFARPYVLKYALDQVTDPTQTTFVPEANVEESLSRFRIAFARDFRFKEAGQAGMFTHLSVGLGLDVGFEQWKFTDFISNASFSDSSTSFGGGFGLLLGLYDDTESFKVNFGLAYQSAVKYEFNIEPDIRPAFDMPQQLNVGLTFYLLEGSPLRLTTDFQWIEWSATAEDPLFGNFESFEDAMNFSLGAEYRFKLNDKLSLYPRAGFRQFDAPWADADDLPMTGPYKLVLDTDSNVFSILTLGAGLSWATPEGKIRSVDIAGDFGGDAFNVAMGYTHEF